VSEERSKMTDLRLDPARAALLVVDVQERLWSAMPPDERERVQRNLLILLELAHRLGMPVVASEQYPKGLGATVPDIAAALASARRFEKLEFSCVASPAFAPIRAAVGRPQWIVAGMEAHVCVYQSVRDLAVAGATVHVPADAVISRTAANRAIGVELCARAGAIVTSTEVLVFDALHVAGTDDFRALSRLVK
jgi:nicotinamidase-related amidase